MYAAVLFFARAAMTINCRTSVLAAKGEYTDVRDGNTYGWVRIGDLEG